jgi:hypothetical protein
MPSSASRIGARIRRQWPLCLPKQNDMRRAVGVAARAVSVGAERGVTPALGCTALSSCVTGRGGVASSRAASSRAPTTHKGRAKEAEQAEAASAVVGDAAQSEWERKVVSALEARGVSLTGPPLWRLSARLPVCAQRAGEPLDMEGAMMELMRPDDPGKIPVYERYGRRSLGLGF